MSFISMKHIHYTVKTKSREEKILFEDLNLSLEQNDFVTLSGLNGVGKTTLSKMIIGIIKPDSGEISLNNHDISTFELHQVGREIGYLFQNTTLQLFNRSVKEELYFASQYGVTIEEDIDKRYKKVFALLDLDKTINTPIAQLSKGEKQRVAIGTILMNDSKFIILDEPTVGLDDERIEGLITTLNRLANNGVGMMVISHNDSFIGQLSARHLRMAHGGQLIEC